MNFFQRLFGTKSIESASQSQIEDIEVNERLFYTDEDPMEKAAQIQVSQEPVLFKILNQDYDKIGFEDGYQIHRPDHLSNRLGSIKAEFRQIYRGELQNLDADIQKLNSFLTDSLKKTLPEQFVRIQSQLDHKKLTRVSLEAELDLALKGEGYCERAVADYRMGFEKGFALYTDERLFTERFLLS